MGSMHLAMGQAPVVLGDIEKNLEIMEGLICEAQRDGEQDIDLIAFPELFITGYNLRDNYNDVAEKIPGKGKAQTEMCRLAKKYGIHITTGIGEKAGKSLFNSAILIGPEGYIGHYRKQFLPNFGPFEEKLFFGEGDNTPVFETPFGKIGIQICYDIFFPETSIILSKQDVSASDGHFVLCVFLINVTTLELQTAAQGQDQLSSGCCVG